jgi:hypothetical protein
MAARIRGNLANIELTAKQLLRRGAYSIAEAMCGRMAAAAGAALDRGSRACLY